MEKSFLLVSLEEEKAKKLANVIGSDTCRRILDSLAKSGATESELSRSLGIPISTVHYNLRQLVDAGLVHAKEFHYSEKGREVNHYSLANKYIIISPSAESLPLRLRRLLPVVFVVGALSVALQLFSRGLSAPLAQQAAVQPMASEAAKDAFVKTAVSSAAEGAAAAVQPAVSAAPGLFQSIGLWFFLGAMAALFVYVLWGYVRERK